MAIMTNPSQLISTIGTCLLKTMHLIIQVAIPFGIPVETWWFSVLDVLSPGGSDVYLWSYIVKAPPGHFM